MARIYEMPDAPTVAEYVHALTVLGERVTEEHLSLFRVHYYAPNRSAPANQIAAWAGVTHWVVVNSQYAQLGRSVCDILRIKPLQRSNGIYRWGTVWSRGGKTRGGFV